MMSKLFCIFLILVALGCTCDAMAGGSSIDAVQCGEIGEKLCKPTKRCVSNCSTCSSPDTKDPPPSEKLEEHYCRHYDCPSGSFLDVENHRCKNWTHCEINEYIKKNASSTSDVVCEFCPSDEISLQINSQSCVKV